MSSTRILIAGIEETNRRLAAVFNDCELTFVATMSEAKTALAEPCDAIVIAVRFDESRMFDLIRYLKADAALSRLPVVCYRSGRRSLMASALGRQGVELAARTLGANDFVDMIGEPSVESGNLKLREAVFRAVRQSRPGTSTPRVAAG
jgi:hypothetical protein